MKWYREYVLKIRSPSTPNQQLGKDVHDFLEAYLLTGVKPTSEILAGAIALSGIHLLPVPKTLDMLVEASVEEIGIASSPVKIKGFIDLLHTHREHGYPVIVDHKTSSSRRWMKKPDQLIQNVQMIVYSKYVLDLNPEHNEVEIAHVYYGTKTRWSDKVSAKVSRGWVERVWSGILGTIKEMVLAYDSAEKTIPKNLNACRMYGGCFHKDICQESDMADLNLLAKLGLTGQAATKVEVEDKPDITVAPEPAEDPKIDTASLIASAESAKPRVLLGGGINPPENEIIVVAPDLTDLGTGDPEHIEKVVQETPESVVVESGLSEGVKKRIKRVRHPETEELITKEARDELFEKVDGMWVRRGYEGEDPVPTEEPVSTEESLPQSVSEMFAAQSQAAQEPETVVETPTVQEPDPPTVTPVSVPAESPRILCIGCLPLKSNEKWKLKSLDEIVAPYAAEACKQSNVAHISLTRFGEGYGIVAGAVAMAGWPEGVDMIYIDPMTKGSDRIIPVLSTLANLVLRKTS